MASPIVIFDPLERLAADFRRMGYPVRWIKMREDWMHREPDEYHDEGETFWSGKHNSRKRGFVAPTFDWEVEEGGRLIRYAGKVRVHAKRSVSSVLGVTTVRWREDRLAQLEDLQTMILKSISSHPTRPSTPTLNEDKP